MMAMFLRRWTNWFWSMSPLGVIGQCMMAVTGTMMLRSIHVPQFTPPVTKARPPGNQQQHTLQVLGPLCKPRLAKKHERVDVRGNKRTAKLQSNADVGQDRKHGGRVRDILAEIEANICKARAVVGEGGVRDITVTWLRCTTTRSLRRHNTQLPNVG